MSFAKQCPSLILTTAWWWMESRYAQKGHTLHLPWLLAFSYLALAAVATHATVDKILCCCQGSQNDVHITVRNDCHRHQQRQGGLEQ